MSRCIVSIMMRQAEAVRVKRWLIGILMLALTLRLVYGLAQDHGAVYGNTGGDSTWYLANGYALLTGMDSGVLLGYGSGAYPIALENLPTPPVYLLFVGVWQAVLPREAAVMVIRALQAIMGTAVCYFAYHLTVRIAENERAGLITAGVLAVSPVFVMETAQIATETLYIFLVAAALTLYLESDRLTRLVTAAVLLGLATLTRAVLLLFPLGLALHLLIVCGVREGLKRAAALLVVYGLVVSTWTVYNVARWNRLVIAGEGFAAFLYIGASGWQGPEAVDQALSDQGELPPDTDDQQHTYRESAGQIIGANPLGWAGRRVSELAGAFLQPHGTLFFSGESLRDLGLTWLREDRTPGGLLKLAQGDAFWPKLALYLFHYAGILGGLVGMWLYRARWRVTLPLIGFILYTALIHLLLTALPRYIFPTEVVWWVFAGAALGSFNRISITNRPVQLTPFKNR